MLYLTRVRLTNVRCFKKIDVRLPGPGTTPGWTVFVGDNASGKSTLLRSIAMGLCDEASAAGLLKESDEGYILRGKNKATIQLELCDSSSGNRKYTITTDVIRKTGRARIFSDIVRQETRPKRDFPWDDLGQIIPLRKN